MHRLPTSLPCLMLLKKKIKPPNHILCFLYQKPNSVGSHSHTNTYFILIVILHSIRLFIEFLNKYDLALLQSILFSSILLNCILKPLYFFVCILLPHNFSQYKGILNPSTEYKTTLERNGGGGCRGNGHPRF